MGYGAGAAAAMAAAAAIRGHHRASALPPICPLPSRRGALLFHFISPVEADVSGARGACLAPSDFHSALGAYIDDYHLRVQQEIRGLANRLNQTIETTIQTLERELSRLSSTGSIVRVMRSDLQALAETSLRGEPLRDQMREIVQRHLEWSGLSRNQAFTQVNEFFHNRRDLVSELEGAILAPKKCLTITSRSR
jgi:hypothetical protein